MGNPASGGRLPATLTVVEPLNATMLRAETYAHAGTSWVGPSRQSLAGWGDGWYSAHVSGFAEVMRLPLHHCVGCPVGGQAGGGGPGTDFLTA